LYASTARYAAWMSSGVGENRPSTAEASSSISMRPSCENASTNPGATTLPRPLICVAPAGAATAAPTSAILPSRISTLAFSSFVPPRWYTVAPVITIACAAALPARSPSAASTPRARTGITRPAPLTAPSLR
jgi:hypothetical protein